MDLETDSPDLHSAGAQNTFAKYVTPICALPTSVLFPREIMYPDSKDYDLECTWAKRFDISEMFGGKVKESAQ